MIKYVKALPVASLLLVAFMVNALPSDSFSVYEEISYDKFGVVDHVQKGDIELKASDSIETIKINYTGKVAKTCKMQLKASVPDVFNPEIKIVKANVPINSDFVFDIKDIDREIEVEVEIKLNQKIDKKEVADKYFSDIDGFLQEDGLFNSYADERIANSIDEEQSILELVEDIKDYTKNALEYSEVETNFDVAESLEAGIGDCDDYARLFVAISRSLSIPARVAFNSKHMWAEVLLPLKDGSYRWVVVDPIESSEISYSLSLDIEPECENYVIEDETWTFEF